MDDKKQRRVYIIITVLLLLVTLYAIWITLWTLFFRESVPVVAPDYALMETDANAELVESSGDKLEKGEGGGAVTMTCEPDARVSLSEKTVTMKFSNPYRSNSDMVLQLTLEKDGRQFVIGQSKKLPPGYKLEKLDLIETEVQLMEGVYKGNYNVLYYDTESGEKAIVNGSIKDIKITVTN